MRIVEKEELFKLANKKGENAFSLLKLWSQDNLITQTDCDKVMEIIKDIKFNYHNFYGFENNFCEVFNKIQIDVYRSFGTYISADLHIKLAALQIPCGNFLLIERRNKTIDFFGLREDLKKENIYDWINSIYWFSQSLKNPDSAKKEIEYFHLLKKIKEHEEILKKIKI